MKKSIRIYATPTELAQKFAGEIGELISESAKKGKPFSIALSGGSTPELLFSVMGDTLSDSVDWEFVHFFWGDERCVPPQDEESNFGMTKRVLLKRIKIPASNVHRIFGENDPEIEAVRYSGEIASNIGSRNGYPEFDLIILGLGEDGHTASIFPSDISAMRSQNICKVATHPLSLQKRITLTGNVINNADLITFMVTGKKKAKIVEKILNKNPVAQNFPASLIVPVYGELRWILDNEAASLL